MHICVYICYCTITVCVYYYEKTCAFMKACVCYVCVCGCIFDLCTKGEGDGISLSSMDNPEQFQTQKQIKETMESGIQL